MGIDRLTVEEAKNYWFDGDPVVYAFGGEGDYEVLALPKCEVIRGLLYLRKLKACDTYGAAQALFTEYSKDPKAPKLIPRIENLENHYEYLLEVWDESSPNLAHHQDADAYADEDPSVEILLENIKNREFIWNEAPPYLDENGNFAACRDFQRWTDAWMPREIVEALGEPDAGFGIDYYEAEFLYKDRTKFQEIFANYGINVQFNSRELRELAGIQ